MDTELFLLILFIAIGLSILPISIIRWGRHAHKDATDEERKKGKFYRNIILTPVILTVIAYVLVTTLGKQLVFILWGFVPLLFILVPLGFFLAIILAITKPKKKKITEN